MERSIKREDLIGCTGTITRRIEIIDAKEGEFGVDVRVRDSMDDEYWIELDDSISLD